MEYLLTDVGCGILQNPDNIESRKIAVADKIYEATIFKDKVLISPGVWNDNLYSKEEIEKAFTKTNWVDKINSALFEDHMDDETSKWLGYVENAYYINGILRGDLVLVDDNMTKKLLFGAKFGISPKVITDIPEEECNGCIKDFLFANFSVVTNPAVKTAFLNKQKTPEEKTDIENKDTIDEKIKNKNIEKMEDEKTESTLKEDEELLKKVDEKIATLSEEIKKQFEESFKNLQETITKSTEKSEKLSEEVVEDPSFKEVVDESAEEIVEETSEEVDEESGEEKLSDKLLSEYSDFVKSYLKEHKGASVEDAAAAFKKSGVKMADEKIVEPVIEATVDVEKDMKAELNKLEAEMQSRIQKLSEKKGAELKEMVEKKLIKEEAVRQTVPTDSVGDKTIKLSDKQLDEQMYEMFVKAEKSKYIK